MSFADRDHLRCRAVHSSGHRCLYRIHEGQHCTIGAAPGWIVWPEAEPTLADRLRERIGKMTDVEVQKLWKKLQEIE